MRQSAPGVGSAVLVCPLDRGGVVPTGRGSREMSRGVAWSGPRITSLNLSNSPDEAHILWRGVVVRLRARQGAGSAWVLLKMLDPWTDTNKYSITGGGSRGSGISGGAPGRARRPPEGPGASARKQTSGDGAGGGGTVSSANVTFFSIHDLRPRPLACPGQPQLANLSNTATAEPSLYC